MPPSPTPESAYGPTMKVLSKRMKSIIKGYQKHTITRPLNISRLEKAKVNKSMEWIPVCLRQIGVKNPMINRRKGWGKEKARISFSQGPVVAEPQLPKARKMLAVFTAVVKIQRWYKRKRLHAKLQRYKSNNYTSRAASQMQLYTNNKRFFSTSINHHPVTSSTFSSPEKHSRIVVETMIDAVKRNTLSYLKKKEEHGQLKPQFTNSKDRQGNTALYYAAYDNRVEIIKVLLKSGADPNIKCESGNTALHIAFKRDHKEAIGILLYYKADPTAPNAESKTPLFYAVPETAKRYGLHKGLVFNYRSLKGK